MPFINLKAAAGQIKQACENSHGRLPFFFLVGAGISSPPIPLASDIVGECEAIARGLERTDEPSGKLPIDVYSHWFQKAYPHPIDRQRFLRGMINGKPISHANFRLAHMLLDKSVANMVVTTNFDDFLSRALTLFGKQHIICDHPNMVERIDPEQKEDIQIIHVHGTHWFYDCCNLSDEISSRAQLSQSTSTMADLLGNILKWRVPLVIGYSGWEGDVVMTALERRLKRGLPYNLYWFCYRQASVECLPNWLKNHKNVYFVVPTHSSQETFPELAVEERRVQNPMEVLSHAGVKGISDKESVEPVLPAHEVLDKLISTFQLKAPDLTSDPLKFFAEQLSNSLPQDDSGRAEVDLYSFRSVINKIEQAKLWEKKHAKAPQQVKMQQVEKQLEKVRDALRRSQYREAIQKGSKIRKRALDSAQLKELLGAMSASASSLNDNSQEELDGYRMVIEIGDILTGRKEMVSDYDVAKALINSGVTLDRLNKHEDALKDYDEVLKRFGETTDTSLQGEVARALINKGSVLFALDRKTDAIDAYEKVLENFGESSESLLCEQVARALVNKGVALGRLKRDEEALNAYDEVLKRFSDSPDPLLFEEVAGALINKGVTLRALNRRPEAIETYDEVIRRFGDLNEPLLREEVARALINKGVTFIRLKKSDEAIAAYREVVERFANATEPNLRKQVARSSVNLGMTYSMLDKRDEALNAYNNVLELFGGSSDPALQEQVANALNGIGFQMLCEAKRIWNDDEAQRQIFLLEAQKKIDAALERAPEEPIFLGNKCYVEFLLGNKDKAREILLQAVNLGGEKIKDIETRDTDIHTIPPDEEFRKLILSIPTSPNGNPKAVVNLYSTQSGPSIRATRNRTP